MLHSATRNHLETGSFPLPAVSLSPLLGAQFMTKEEQARAEEWIEEKRRLNAEFTTRQFIEANWQELYLHYYEYGVDRYSKRERGNPYWTRLSRAAKWLRKRGWTSRKKSKHIKSLTGRPRKTSETVWSIV